MPFNLRRDKFADVPPEDFIDIPQPDYDSIPTNDFINMYRDAQSSSRGAAEILSQSYNGALRLGHFCEDDEDSVRLRISRSLPWDKDILLERLSFAHEKVLFEIPTHVASLTPILPVYGRASFNTVAFAQMMWDACYPDGALEPDMQVVEDLVLPFNELVCALPFLYGYAPTGADDELRQACLETVASSKVLTDDALYGYEDAAISAMETLNVQREAAKMRFGRQRSLGIFRASSATVVHDVEETIGEAARDFKVMMTKAHAMGWDGLVEKSPLPTYPPAPEGVEHAPLPPKNRPEAFYHNGAQELVPYTFAYRRRYGYINDILNRGLSFLVAAKSVGHHDLEDMLWMNEEQFREFILENKCAVAVCETVDHWQDCLYLAHTANAFGYIDDDVEYLAMVSMNGTPASYNAMRELAAYVKDETPSDVVVAQTAKDNDACIAEDFGARCPTSYVRYHPLYDNTGMRAYWQWLGEVPQSAIDTYERVTANHLFGMLSSFAHTLFDYRKKVTGELSDRYISRLTDKSDKELRQKRASREEARALVGRFLMSPDRAPEMPDEYNNAYSETTRVYVDLHAADPKLCEKIESRNASFVLGAIELIRGLTDDMTIELAELRRKTQPSGKPSPSTMEEYYSQIEKEQEGCTPIEREELFDMLYDFLIEQGYDIMIDALYDGVPLDDLLS